MLCMMAIDNSYDRSGHVPSCQLTDDGPLLLNVS